MITIEEATKIAKERNKEFDTVQEYSDAFVFYKDDGVTHEGGGDAACIIEKRNGGILRFAQYFLSDKYSCVEIGTPQRIE